MKSDVTIAADDFGLTRGITDTILETVDGGPVRLVSIAANGEAVAYALDEYQKRASTLTLAVHLTLTEGPSLSAPESIPHLVDARGVFKHSILGLWSAYLFGTRAKRASLRAEVRSEMNAQCAVIRAALNTDKLVVNGHQHVHLIPFVFDELVTLSGIMRIRTIREPFQWTWSPLKTLAHFVLASLSGRAARIARLRAITTNDSFVGFLHSGRMTEEALRTGLSKAKGSVEALLHPGSAAPGELVSWQGSRADIAWHYSPWRAKEREMLVTHWEN